jgi:hypothetical protein
VGALAVRGTFGMRAAIATDMVAAGARVSTATRLAVNAGEGIVGAAVENTAQEVGQAAVEGAEGFDSKRSTRDILTDWAVGTLAAGALQTGVAEASFGATRLSRMLKSTSPEAADAVLRNVVQAVDSDIVPDTTALTKALAKETSVLPQDFGHAPYKFDPVTKENLSTRKFYAATTDANPDLKLGTKADLGDDYGFGTHVSDNPGVANAASARSMADSPGLVHEVEIRGELNPLPIAQSVSGDPELATGLAKILSSVVEDAETAIADTPIKDVLAGIRDLVDDGALPKTALDDVEALIKERGYNALIDDGSTRLGEAHEPHNHITLLDDSLIEGKQAFEPDSRVVKVPEQADLQVAADVQTNPNSKFFVDTDEHASVKTDVESFRAEAREDLAKFSQTVDEAIEELNSLKDQGMYTDAEIESYTRELTESRRMAEEEHTFLKYFKACAGA